VLTVNEGTTERAIPRNIEAERSVLGSALLEPEGIVRVLVERLKPEHFCLAQHRVIFRAIRELYERGEPAEIVAVANRLNEKHEMEVAGGRLYLNELLDRVTTTASVEYYAEILKRKAVLRGLIEAGGRITELGYEEARDSDEVLTLAESIVTALSENSAGKEFAPQTVAELRGAGIPPREDVLAGTLPKAGLLLLAAPPKSGKTMLALNLAVAVAKGRPFLDSHTLAGPVLYLSGEGGVVLVDERLAKMVTPDDPALGRVFVWGPQPGHVPVMLDNAADRRRITRFAKEMAVVMIVVDPLVAFHASDENDTQGMGKLVAGILSIGVDTGAGIVLCHHSRKPGPNSRAGSPQEARGSSVLHGAVSASMILTKRDKDTVLYSELRYAPSPTPKILTLDSATLTFAATGELQQGARKLDADKLLAIFHEASPQRLGYDELCARTGRCERTVRPLLMTLLAGGLIQEGKDGQRKVWNAIEEDVPF